MPLAATVNWTGAPTVTVVLMGWPVMTTGAWPTASAVRDMPKTTSLLAALCWWISTARTLSPDTMLAGRGW